MVLSSKVRQFFAPDDVGTGGSGTSSGEKAASAATPFDKINLDDLDSETRATIEASKAEFVTLQKNLAEEKESKKRLEGVTSQYQSKADAMEAKLKKLSAEQPSVEEAKIAKIEAILLKKGVSAEQAKAQAPLFTEMFGEFAAELKGEIGRDLAPLGASVMHQAANVAWQQALQRDKLGALQNQEVAQKTWEAMQHSLNQGQPVTADSILALRNIFHTEFLENGGAQQQQQMPQPQQLPNYGPPSFGGGGFAPARPQQQDQNAPKHAVNADTANAVARTIAYWPKKKGGK